MVGLDTRQVYAQVGFTGKKQDAEAKAGRAALERIDLPGRVVVFDALHTQRATVEQIIAAGGYYLAPVKQNQPTLCAALEGLDWSRCRSGSMTWLSGGRVQTHTIWVTGEMADGPQRLPFPGAQGPPAGGAGGVQQPRDLDPAPAGPQEHLARHGGDESAPGVLPGRGLKPAVQLPAGCIPAGVR